MVELVADGAGEKAAGGELLRLAEAVEKLHRHLHGAAHDAAAAAHGQAALVADLFPLRLHDDGVDELEKALFHVDDHGAAQYAHLRGGKAGALFFADSVLHVV